MNDYASDYANTVKRMTAGMTIEDVFSDNPGRGAEYVGECAKISIFMGHSNEAGQRARLASRFALAVQLRESVMLSDMGISGDLL